MARRGKITVQVTIKRTVRVTTRTRPIITSRPFFDSVPARRLIAPGQCIECGATNVALTSEALCHDCAVNKD
jgi:hypothetical protein